MADQPLKPQFFVVREQNRMVPLVALDELPDHLVFRDISRVLSPRDIQGMTCAGSCDTRHQKYSVQTMIQSPITPLGEEGLSQLMQAALTGDLSAPTAAPTLPPVFAPSSPEVDSASIAHPISAGPKVPVASADQEPAQQVESNTATSVEVPVLPSQPSVDLHYIMENIMTMTEEEVSLLPHGIKIFCTHWCRTNTCDFTQQGCKYKHEMPVTRYLLKFAGMSDIPAWYRQEYGLGSFQAVPGSDASFARSSLKSRIASRSRPEIHQSSSNWRSVAAGGSSDSGSDVRPQFAKSGNRSARGNGRGSPLNPSRLTASKQSTHTAESNLGVVASANPKTPDPIKRFQSRRASHASVFSDFEAEIYREDAARKSQEETDQASITSTSSKGSDEKTQSKATPAKTSNLGAAGSVSGAANRRRGGRGGSKKAKALDSSSEGKKE